MTRTRNPNWKVQKLQQNARDFFRITNLKTGKVYNLIAAEFVYGCGMYNEIVETFPNYVHYKVWDM